MQRSGWSPLFGQKDVQTSLGDSEEFVGASKVGETVFLRLGAIDNSTDSFLNGTANEKSSTSSDICMFPPLEGLEIFP